MPDIQTQILILKAMVTGLPHGVREVLNKEVEQLADKHQEEVKRQSDIIFKIREELSSLRVNIKYLEFDLSATKRELTQTTNQRDELATYIEEMNGDDEGEQ